MAARRIGDLVTRVTNFNYTGLAEGRLNFRFGHFELPYGLEVPVNTNGTLRQLGSQSNLGIKADWGFSINGSTESFKYDLTLSNGLGQDINLGSSTHAVTGRIGTPDDQETEMGTPGFGISAFHGDIWSKGKLLERWRVGVDTIAYVGPLTLLAELSAGEDDADPVINALAEANWSTPSENLLVYLQTSSIHEEKQGDWDSNWSSALGLRYRIDNKWSVSSQIRHDFSNDETSVVLQARVRL